MKNIASCLLIASLLFSVIACEKKNDAPDFGSWKLGTTTYKVAFSTKSALSTGGTLFIFADAAITGPGSTANMLSVSFPTAPTTSGTYQLVNAGTSTGSNQMELSSGSMSGGAYGYIGSPINVTVNVAGGKISVTVPEITLKSTTGLPDISFSGSVKEM